MPVAPALAHNNVPLDTMNTTLLAIVILCGVGSWIYSCLFLLLGIENLRYWKQHQSLPAPLDKLYARTCIMIPCKGDEDGLRENLDAFMAQDHPNYEVRFVVESMLDPAYEIICDVMASHPFVAAYAIDAGRAIDCGQKVHNLNKAVDSLEPSIDVYVFADSDASPRTTWLRWLVSNVGRENVGARTGYRWMMPQTNNLPTLLVCTINNALAAMMGRGAHHLVWGGSWAIHRNVFNAAGIREAWNSVLSDDLTASRALKLSKLRIEFEPQAVCASQVRFSWSSMFEFLRRQLIIARHYAPQYWTGTLLTSLITQTGFWGSLVLGVSALSHGNHWGWPLLVSAAGLYATGIARSVIRQKIGQTAQRKWTQHPTARAFDLLAGPFTGVVTLAILLVSAFKNRIVWRGIGYHIASSGRVSLLGRKFESANWPVDTRDHTIAGTPTDLDSENPARQTLLTTKRRKVA